MIYHSQTNIASVGSVFNDMRKVKVVSLPETIKEKSTFRAKALHRGLRSKIGPSSEMSIFPLSFQVVRESLPFNISLNNLTVKNMSQKLKQSSYLTIPEQANMVHKPTVTKRAPAAVGGA